jgi:hypothetical protein
MTQAKADEELTTQTQPKARGVAGSKCAPLKLGLGTPPLRPLSFYSYVPPLALHRTVARMCSFYPLDRAGVTPQMATRDFSIVTARSANRFLHLLNDGFALQRASNLLCLS